MVKNKKINDDIPEIPDIDPEIYNAAAKGELVIFIGAGVSKIVGAPLWKEFAKLMLRNLFEKNCISYYEYKNLEFLEDSRKLLSICENIYKEKNIERNYKSFFQNDLDKNNRYNNIYEDLYKFNAIYVTTNYDTFLDQVLNNLKKKGNLIKNKKDSVSQQSFEDLSNVKIINKKDELLISNLNYKNIIHLHGSIENLKTMIVSTTDYLKHYEKESETSFFLEEIFQIFTVLFVGYGLDEYEVMEFLLSRVKHAKNEIKHFMLYPSFNSEKNLLKFQENYYADLGIKLVPYQIDKIGYNQLALVIEKWAEQIGPIAKKRRFLERIKIIDEVVR